MTKPIFDASKTGLPLLRSFLAGLYGRDRLNRVWLAGFRDIQDPSWYGCRGVDALARRIGVAQLDHADLFFCIGVLSPEAKGRTLGEVVDQPVLIADDIGTKADRAMWEALFAMGLPEPTFRIETSPGNETWGWKIAGDTAAPEHGEGMALIRAYMVERKLTDNVMDATRYVRLPWGYNSKPKYRADTGAPLASSPQVRLSGGTGQPVELEALGQLIVPGGANWRQAEMPAANMTSAQLNALPASSLSRTASMEDPIVRLADAIGLQPQPSTRPGVIDALCPNMGQHSDRPETGFAFLGNGLCRCQHASCAEIRTPQFEAMMVERYDQLVAARAAVGADVSDMPASGHNFLALEDFQRHGVRFDATPEADAERQRVQEEADALAGRQQEARADRKADFDQIIAGLCARFVWINDLEVFADTQQRTMLTKSQLDTHRAVIAVCPLSGSAKNRGSTLLLNHHDRQDAHGQTYAPGVHDPVVNAPTKMGPRPHVNMWAPTRLGRRAGEPSAWLELARRLIPHDDVRRAWLCWMARMIQHPELRTHIVPILKGGQGIGKDQWLHPFFQCIGLHNVRQVDQQQLESRFNGFLRSSLVYLPETQFGRDGRAYSLMKMWTGAEDTIEIEDKYQSAQPYVPTANFIGATNSDAAIAGMDSDDRRFCFYASDAPKMTAADADRIVGELKTTAELERVHNYLAMLDLSGFEPRAEFPDPNNSRALALVASLTDAARWVHDQCQPGGVFADRKFLTVQDVKEAATAARAAPGYLYDQAVTDGLNAAGCKRLERQVRRGDGSRVRLWFGPGADDEFRAAMAQVPPADVAAAADKDLEDERQRMAAALGV